MVGSPKRNLSRCYSPAGHGSSRRLYGGSTVASMDSQFLAFLDSMSALTGVRTDIVVIRESISLEQC